MSVPNLKSIVQAVYDDGSFDLSTKEGCGAFTRACAMALHAKDPAFGMLEKSAGRTHVVDVKGRRHAVDAVLYKTTGQSVDIISNSATATAKPSWSVDIPRYSDGDWFTPDYDVTEPPEPPPPPFDPSQLFTRMAVLEARMTTVETALAGTAQVANAVALAQNMYERTLAQFEQRLMDVESRPASELPALVAEGTTGRTFGHGHTVSLTVRKKE